MADWVTISSLATAGGTLVLAAATFAAVRSSNRSARIAELALQEQRAPVLVNARLDDPEQKIGFGDGHWTRVAGGGASVQADDGALYLVMSLRNVGAGIAVLQSWHINAGTEPPDTHAPLEGFSARHATCSSPAATSACGRARSATATIRVSCHCYRRSESDGAS